MRNIVGKPEAVTICRSKVGWNVVGIDKAGRLVLLGKSGTYQAAKVKANYWATELRVHTIEWR